MQKQSWVMLKGKYHFQRNGVTICKTSGLATFEDINPPLKERCKECNKNVPI